MQAIQLLTAALAAAVDVEPAGERLLAAALRHTRRRRIAYAIAQLLDEPGRWPRLSQSGRARIETHYQNQAWLDRLEQLYHSLNT